MVTHTQTDDGLRPVGRCRCGAVTVHAAGKPLQISYCHCEDCRKASGAPVSVFVGFPEDRVRIEGKLTVYSDGPTSRGYCPTCGTPVVYDDGRLASRWLMLGVMDAPEDFVPQMHAFESERLPWFEIADDLPRHERFTVRREEGQ